MLHLCLCILCIFRLRRISAHLQFLDMGTESTVYPPPARYKPELFPLDLCTPRDHALADNVCCQLHLYRPN